MKKMFALLLGVAIVGGFAATPAVKPQAANNSYIKIKGSMAPFNIDLKVTATTPAKQAVQTYTAKGQLSKMLPANTRWNVVGEQLVGKNDVRYDLGGGYWVKATTVSPTTTPSSLFTNFKNNVYVANPVGYSSMISTEISGSAGDRILPSNTRWRYYQKVFHSFNFWYNLGGNQWVTSMNGFA